MTDLHTLVERELDRAGVPSYSFDDLARRRERTQRNRRIAAGAVAIALVGLGIGGWLRALTLDRSTPALPPAPVERTWCGPDRTACHGPGTYRFSFWPRLDATLPIGWSLTTYDQEHIHAEWRSGTSEDRTLLVGREPWVVENICHGLATRGDSPPTAEGVASALAGFQRLVTTSPEPVVVGGLVGVRLDVEVAVNTPPCSRQEFQPLAGAEDGYGEYEAATLGVGERSRIIILQIPRTCTCVEPDQFGLIAIEFGGPIDEFDQIVAEVQPVLDSLVFDLEAERHGPRSESQA